MQILSFNCYKVAPKIPLEKIAEVSKINKPLIWKEYIVLEGEHLDMFLRYQAEGKSVYIFKFGSITFVNFNEDEVRSFLENIELIVGPLDYDLFAKYYEGHTLKLDGQGYCQLVKGEDFQRYKKYIADVISIVLAKSVALYKVEKNVDYLYDEAEKVIHFLQIGKLRTNIRKFAKGISKILRFEYESVDHIKIFDRQIFIGWGLEAKEAYEKMAGYYELGERFKGIKNKADDLMRITRSYAAMSYKHGENRLYLFEIFLLALFPLSYFLHYIID
ncbi:MAG: RMD1 family protein [Clostridia bacterium]|nr:RMD1 family protein [Clostridia bacterium]